MQCPNPTCRTMNEADASFCENCGTRLSPAAPLPLATPPAPAILPGPPVKVSRAGLFAAALWISVVLLFFAALLAAEQDADSGAVIALPAIVLLLASWIYAFVTLHRCWSVVQANTNVTTPGMAVGLLFIPIFNFYWCFVATARLAGEAGKYLASLHGIKSPIGKGASITFCLLAITAVCTIASPFGILAMVFSQFVLTVLMFQWAAFLRAAAARQATARQAA
jgi:hypothetical protein